MLSDEMKVKCKRYGITAKKYGGDDSYSWAVFIKGQPFVTGLSRGEVDYYKRRAIESVERRMYETKSTSSCNRCV